mgnify:FL=1
MKSLAEFVSLHLEDDTTRLILNKDKWPETDVEMAVNCIESRRKLRGKVQEWYEIPELVFPNRISAEQCSSSATAGYKARLAERIATMEYDDARWKIADLTGGLGVDSWFFSQKADAVLYNEMQSQLCKAAEYNFGILSANNITVVGNRIDSDNIHEVLDGFDADIIYLDPARRSSSGKKVFLIEECTPDVLTMKEQMFEISRHILIKLSPMADITMVCGRLGSRCREVHIVSAGGECKELLVWMDREWEGTYSIIPIEIDNSSYHIPFTFTQQEEKESRAAIYQYGKDIPAGNGLFLFEPGKSLMKAGPFNMISSFFGIAKLGRSTHYYITEDRGKAAGLCRYGKVYLILETDRLDKKSIRKVSEKYRKAEVTARNIQIDTETLRKKLCVTSGDDAHIFGLHSDVYGNLLLCTQRMLEKDLQAH